MSERRKPKLGKRVVKIAGESSMRIHKIDWISKESLEAEVTVTDGILKVICFAHPLTYPDGSRLREPIDCYGTTNIVRADDNEYKVEKLTEYFSYYIMGRLIDQNNGIVRVGGL
jgi:hypothetical protein